MKIAMVVKDLATSGGTQRQFVELANYLQHNNHQVVLYTVSFDPERCYPELVKDLEVRSIEECEGTQTKHNGSSTTSRRQLYG